MHVAESWRFLDRPEEIGKLARLFCREFGENFSRPETTLSAEAVALLEAQTWRGNVRELRNFVERSSCCPTTPCSGRPTCAA